MVTALGFTRKSMGVVVFADGTQHSHETFEAEVEWAGYWRRTLVSAVGKEPLLGSRFLAGHKLIVEMVSGGAVEISQLPRQSS